MCSVAVAAWGLGAVPLWQWDVALWSVAWPVPHAAVERDRGRGILGGDANQLLTTEYSLHYKYRLQTRSLIQGISVWHL